MSNRHKVSVMITDAECVYVHGSFSKHRNNSGGKISLSASYLSTMNGQAEQYFAVVMDMVRAMLKTSGMNEKCWDLASHYIIYLKIACRLRAWVTGPHIRWCSNTHLTQRMFVYLALAYRRGCHHKSGRAAWRTELVQEVCWAYRF